MPTLGELVDSHEEALFVGRERLVDEFLTWVRAEQVRHVLFNVTGHGGVGKTALLRAFARQAREAGRAVRFIDGRDLDLTPDSLHRELGGEDLATAVHGLNETQPVVLLDSFEQAAGLTRHLLDGVLPELDATVRVVVASRRPLIEPSRSHRLADHVRELRLTPFEPHEVDEYLRRRGVDSPAAADHVRRASGGNPLALSIAADLVQDFGVRDLRATSDWRHAVAALADRLFADVDSTHRLVLEAACVVRQFDRATLAALTGVTDEALLRDIIQLAMIRPTPHGARVHDDVRAIVTDTLRARDPSRYHQLRAAALAHYSQRLLTAGPAERPWLVNERLYLWEHDFIRGALFPAEELSDDVFLEAARPEDHQALRDLWADTADRPSTTQGGAPSDDLSDDEVSALLDSDASRFIIARHRDGGLLAAGVELLIGRDALPIAPGVLRPVLETYFGDQHPMPDHAAESTLRYLGPIFGHPGDGDVAMAKLARWAVGSWIHGGTVLVGTTMAGYAGLMEMLGHRRLTVDASHEGRPVHGLVLDLEPTEVETWIRRITQLEPPTPEQPGGQPDPHRTEIRLLGGFGVVHEGSDVTPTGLSAQAIKHLALEKHLHVEELADCLWPEVDSRTGRARLRNVLSRVRDVAPDLIVREGDVLRLGDGLLVDVRAFVEEVGRATALAPAAEAEEVATLALERYAGDLLPGELYVDRFATHRERLRRLRLDAHDVLVRVAEHADELEEAARRLEATIELDRFDESRYLRLAQLLHRSGQDGRALIVLRQARQVCAELGVSTSRDLRELEQALHA